MFSLSSIPWAIRTRIPLRLIRPSCVFFLPYSGFDFVHCDQFRPFPRFLRPTKRISFIRVCKRFRRSFNASAYFEIRPAVFFDNGASRTRPYGKGIFLILLHTRNERCPMKVTPLISLFLRLFTRHAPRLSDTFGHVALIFQRGVRTLNVRVRVRIFFALTRDRRSLRPSALPNRVKERFHVHSIFQRRCLRLFTTTYFNEGNHFRNGTSMKFPLFINARKDHTTCGTISYRVALGRGSRFWLLRGCFISVFVVRSTGLPTTRITPHPTRDF